MCARACVCVCPIEVHLFLPDYEQVVLHHTPQVCNINPPSSRIVTNNSTARNAVSTCCITHKKTFVYFLSLATIFSFSLSMLHSLNKNWMTGKNKLQTPRLKCNISGTLLHKQRWLMPSSRRKYMQEHQRGPLIGTINGFCVLNTEMYLHTHYGIHRTKQLSWWVTIG